MIFGKTFRVSQCRSQEDEAQYKFLGMYEHVRQKEKELAAIETKLRKARQEYEPYRELNLIHELFPMMKEQLRIANFCLKTGFAVEHICRMFRGNTLTINSGKLYSPEHDRKFEVTNAKLKIENEPDNPNKLRLNINEMNILEWFRQKYREVQRKYDFAGKQGIVKGVRL
jgi:hypothetical protein